MLALSASACATATGGAATDVPSPDPSSSSSDPSSSISAAPASDRPRDINIATVDPCSVLTTAQLDELRLRPNVLPPVRKDAGAVGCTYLHKDDPFALTLILDSAQGYQKYLSPAPDKVITEGQVSGYKAVSVVLTKDDACIVGIDINDGQTLTMSSQEPPGQPPTNICDANERSAAAAIQSLSSK
ncbi:hypothetical protein GCM10027047_35410 [Rhodococcus aerolatus]